MWLQSLTRASSVFPCSGRGRHAIIIIVCWRKLSGSATFGVWLMGTLVRVRARRHALTEVERGMWGMFNMLSLLFYSLFICLFILPEI